MPKRDLTSFQEFDQLMSSRGNYAEYRRTLQEVQGPCLPYFGIYLTDVTFAEDGNPDFLARGKINFTKRWKMFGVLSDIERFQGREYVLQEVPEIRKFLENVKSIDEDERYGIAKRLTDLKKAATAAKRNSASKFSQTVSGLFKSSN